MADQKRSIRILDVTKQKPSQPKYRFIRWVGLSFALSTALFLLWYFKLKDPSLVSSIESSSSTVIASDEAKTRSENPPTQIHADLQPIMTQETEHLPPATSSAVLEHTASHNPRMDSPFASLIANETPSPKQAETHPSPSPVLPSSMLKLLPQQPTHPPHRSSKQVD